MPVPNLTTNPLVEAIADSLNAKKLVYAGRESNPDAEVVVFEGYLGPKRDDGWWQLFDDMALQGYLLLQETDVLLNCQVSYYKNEPWKRDRLWLRGDASVAQRSQPLLEGDIEGLARTGGFTQASQLAISIADGRPSDPPGIFSPIPPGGYGRWTRYSRR